MVLRLPSVRAQSKTTPRPGDDLAKKSREELRSEEVLSSDCGSERRDSFLNEPERDGNMPLTKAFKNRILSRTTTSNTLFGLGLERVDTADSRSLDAEGRYVARDHSAINHALPCRPGSARTKNDRNSRRTTVNAIRKMSRLLGFGRSGSSRSTSGLDEAVQDTWQPHEGLSRRLNYRPRRHGRTFCESYDLGIVLGGGGFAVVRDGTVKADGEPCAIKVMYRSDGVDMDALFHEVSILRSLQHSQIVRFIDFYEEPETFYLVLEKVTGGELFERIVLAGRFSEADARAFVRSLLVALAYCHSKKVAHRDIKPENILVASLDPGDRTIKLADFGLARSVANGRVLGDPVGTPSYMAPEILKRVPHGTQVDCWGVGIVTHILLGGYLPFSSPRTDKLFHLIKKGRVDFYDACWSAVSLKAREFILDLLKVDQDVRLTVKGALKHPWLKETGKAAMDGDDLCRSMVNLRVFNAKSKFRAAVNTFVAVQRLHSLVLIPSQQGEVASGTKTTAGHHAAVNTSSSHTSVAQSLTPARGVRSRSVPRDAGTRKSTAGGKSKGASDAAIVSSVAAGASVPLEPAINDEGAPKRPGTLVKDMRVIDDLRESPRTAQLSPGLSESITALTVTATSLKKIVNDV